MTSRFPFFVRSFFGCVPSREIEKSFLDHSGLGEGAITHDFLTTQENLFLCANTSSSSIPLQHNQGQINKMNCPSRTEEPPEGDGMNQNPSSLSADLTTRNDLNGIANTRLLRRIESSEIQSAEVGELDGSRPPEKGRWRGEEMEVGDGHGGSGSGAGGSIGGRGDEVPENGNFFMRMRKLAVTFGKFIGPGFMVCHFFSFSIEILKRVLTKSLDRRGLYRSRQLRNRCRSWCDLQVQTIVHRFDVQPLCHFPPKLMYQAWKC